jgi:uncharacterized heparinase superfamily protein
VGDAKRVASDAARGTFEAVGVVRSYDEKVLWEDPSASRLFRFWLNSFDFAWPIAVDGDHADSLARLVEDWIACVPRRRSDPWHPFVVGSRLLNLLGTREVWLPHVRDQDRTIRGLWEQATFLRRTLERDIGGNHLIREATALVVAGSAFSDRRTANLGRRIIESEVLKQVLPDGGHYERSPSYHLEVMADLLDAARSATLRVRPGLLQEMADFAASMCHPDGQVAMFNDCAFPSSQPVPYLRALGLEPLTKTAFAESGYFILGDGDDRLIFDAGPPSPQHLPPHAHCDLLSFELSVGGSRFLVNSGTGDYERGPWRDYWRSTRAHNTVEIDGTNQSEVWDSFRMARRARPLDVTELHGREGVRGVTGAHDGYRRLVSPVIHRRTVATIGDGWVVVDSLQGTGTHAVRSLLHTPPEVSMSVSDGAVDLSRGDHRIVVEPLGDLQAQVRGSSTEPIENWHATRLGERQRSRAVTLEGKMRLPVSFGWFISRRDRPTHVRLDGDATGFALTTPDGEVVLRKSGSHLSTEGAA